MTGRAGCPDTESLAQLIDGRTGEQERALLLAHLDGCEFCLDVLIESQRFVYSRGLPSRPRAAVRIDRWLRLPHPPKVELE